MYTNNEISETEIRKKVPLNIATRAIVYIKNPIDSNKKLLDLINEFDKTVGYKVNIQKLKAFLYTKNEISETDIKKKVPIDIATRKIKNLETT